MVPYNPTDGALRQGEPPYRSSHCAKPASTKNLAFRTALSLMGAVACPLISMSISLVLWDRYGKDWGTAVGWTILLLSVGTGVACLAALPVHPIARMVLVSIYVAPAGWFLFVYSFFFVGFMFGDWL